MGLYETVSSSAIACLGLPLSKNEKTSTEDGEDSAGGELIGCLWGLLAEAVLAFGCFEFDFSLEVRRERDTDSRVTVEPLPLEPPEEVVIFDSNDRREDTTAFFVPDCFARLSLFPPRVKMNMADVEFKEKDLERSEHTRRLYSDSGT